MKPTIILIFFVMLLFQSCVVHKGQFEGKPFVAHRTLEDTDFSQSRLDALTTRLQSLPTTAMMILQNGKVVYEYGDLSQVSYIASCRKSVLSMLYGKHVENGNISLDQDIGSLGIEEDIGLLPIEKRAKVGDVISSRSGVFLRPANKGYDEQNILKRGSVEPGSYFVYNNWDFNVAGHILELAAGQSVYEELETQLAIPLGFQDWHLKNQHKKFKKKNSRFPAYHIYISTRDMAKIGQLMLNEGKWNGEQLISKDWIEKSTSTITPVETVNQRASLKKDFPYQFSYGYMWWLVDNFQHHPDFKGAYSASGFGGQFITIIPSRNIVVVHKCKLSLLELAGLKSGGISNYTYWELLHDFVGQ